MKPSLALIYFFIFQAVMLVVSGAAQGQYQLVCFGLVLALVCTAILRGNRQRAGGGRVHLPALNGQATYASSYSSAAVWSTGGDAPIDRYQSVMARLRLAPSTGQTAASLVKQHKRWFNGGESAARAFFHHPHVVKALGLGGAHPQTEPQAKAPSSTQKPSKATADLQKDSFWGNLEQTATKSAPAADGVCGMANCSNEVNAFSFQCFQCRNRVCSSCGNSGVLCHTCAS